MCTVIAVSWIVGSLIGLAYPLPWWIWVAAAVAPIAWIPATLGMHARRTRFFWVIVPLLLASGRAALEDQTVPDDHLAQCFGQSHTGPVRVQVVVERTIRRGLFAGRARSTQLSCGSWIPVRGEVVVSGWEDSVRPGAMVEVFGRGRTTRYQGRWSVFIEVFDRAQVHQVKHPSLLDTWLSNMRTGTRMAMVAAPVRQDERSSLIAAITLGDRDHMWSRVATPFRATGTAHLLAVSGLHLAILCGLIVFISRWIGGTPRRTFLLVILITLVLMTIGDVRTPLARAGIMVVIASTLLVCRWRVSVGTLWSIAVLVVLWEDPLAVSDVSFQLSFSVVAALVWVLPVWSNRTAVSGAPPLRGVMAARVAVMAWLIASPIAAHHFGMFSPIGIPATLLLTPIVAAILWFGYLRLLVCWCDPVDFIVGWVLDAFASALWWSVDMLDTIPTTPIETAKPGWTWVVCVIAASVCMVSAQSVVLRRSAGLLVVSMWFGLLWIDIHLPP